MPVKSTRIREIFIFSTPAPMDRVYLLVSLFKQGNDFFLSIEDFEHELQIQLAKC